MMTTWNPEPETFSFFSAYFDVAEAKRVLAEKSHKVGELAIADVAKWVGEPGKMVAGIAVDWDRVQSDATIDLSVPVIFAWTKAGSLFPIDGWHRIARAKLQGVSSLPAVMLNKKESRRCWL